jgi:hypothetical protein
MTLVGTVAPGGTAVSFSIGWVGGAGVNGAGIGAFDIGAAKGPAIGAGEAPEQVGQPATIGAPATAP